MFVASGALYTGYLANHLDLSPNYASVLYGITSTFGTIPSFVAPLMVAALTNGQVPFLKTFILKKKNNEKKRKPLRRQAFLDLTANAGPMADSFPHHGRIDALRNRLLPLLRFG